MTAVVAGVLLALFGAAWVWVCFQVSAPGAALGVAAYAALVLAGWRRRRSAR